MILSSALFAAVPLFWSVETSRLQPVAFDAVRGETLLLQADFNAYGEPLEIPSDAFLYYQTNGMDASWWSIPATVASNRVSATFAPSNDPGASVVSGFLGSSGQIYRASFFLRFRHGPGATPNTLPIPKVNYAETDPTVPDWAKAASPPASLADNALVLTNDTLQTRDGSFAAAAWDGTRFRLGTKGLCWKGDADATGATPFNHIDTNGLFAAKAHASGGSTGGGYEYGYKLASDGLHLYGVNSPYGGSFDCLYTLDRQYSGALATERYVNVAISEYNTNYAYSDDKARAAMSYLLNGVVYDFQAGTNFAQNLYAAVTNLIRRLGGNIDHPPTFED